MWAINKTLNVMGIEDVDVFCFYSLSKYIFSIHRWPISDFSTFVKLASYVYKFKWNSQHLPILCIYLNLKYFKTANWWFFEKNVSRLIVIFWKEVCGLLVIPECVNHWSKICVENYTFIVVWKSQVENRFEFVEFDVNFR